MARYITLSKAARLVGVKRGALQKQIRAGELTTFEGMLDVNQLLQAYPDTRMEDNTMIERVERFMEQAFAKAMRAEAEALDLHTLAKRVSLLSQELAAAKSEINRYTSLVEQFKQRVAGLTDDDDINGFKRWFLHVLEGKDEAQTYPEELLAQEAFLRIMAAHVRLLPSGHDFFVEGTNDLLESGLGAGIPLHYGCSDGSCGRCRARVISGEVRQTREPAFALSEQEQEQGYCLMCCHTAVTDLVLEAAESRLDQPMREQTIATEVRRISAHGNCMTVVQVTMPSQQRLEFLAGQYVHLKAPDGREGEFPLASCPCDETKLEFHVECPEDPDAEPSPFARLTPREPVQVRGPYGQFVLRQDSDRPMVCIAVNTGFASAKGLIEHAMALDMVESVRLIWAATPVPGHYLDNLCRSWADALDNFQYQPLSLTDLSAAAGATMEAVAAAGVELASSDLYVSAPEEAIGPLREQLLAAGADETHLYLGAVAGTPG